MSIHNVRDYGAVGDGTTDDTAAVQRAVDAASPRRGSALAPILLFGFALLLALLAHVGCAGALPDPNAQKLVRCELGVVEQRVADGTVLSLAAEALASGEYAKAIDALIERIGVDTVRCAVQTIADVAGLPELRSGPSLSGPPASTPTPTTSAGKGIDIAARATEISRAKGWR